MAMPEAIADVEARRAEAGSQRVRRPLAATAAVAAQMPATNAAAATGSATRQPGEAPSHCHGKAWRAPRWLPIAAAVQASTRNGVLVSSTTASRRAVAV